MTVPAGKRRVLLVGGRRHGQWHDIDDTLPDTINVLAPPRPLTFTPDDPSSVGPSPYDSYQRAKACGLRESGVSELVVYATGDTLRDGLALNSAVHLGWCHTRGYLPTCRPELHDVAEQIRRRY